MESARKGTEMRVHLMDDFYLMMLVTKKTFEVHAATILYLLGTNSL